MTDFLSLEDLLEIAEGILPDVRVRDLGLLESAAARPRTTVLGEFAYPDLLTQASALLHSLARNHCLLDGNKRLAWASMRIFLIMNDYDIHYDVDDAEQLVLGVSRGEIDVQGIHAWLSQGAKKR